MGGDMSKGKLASIAALALLLPACSLLPQTHPERWTTVESNHTIQELCDFPKQFFASRYDAPNLIVSVIATKPITDKIGTGNGCGYDTPRGEYLGYVSMLRMHDDETPSKPDGVPVRTLAVGGVVVAQYVEPVPEPLDPATTRPRFKLAASVDGWEGTLEFKNGDDQGAQTGAQMLIDMIRALKS
ncbi:hypothetical protein [Nocardia beijingensis]